MLLWQFFCTNNFSSLSLLLFQPSDSKGANIFHEMLNISVSTSVVCVLLEIIFKFLFSFSFYTASQAFRRWSCDYCGYSIKNQQCLQKVFLSEFKLGMSSAPYAIFPNTSFFFLLQRHQVGGLCPPLHLFSCLQKFPTACRQLISPYDPTTEAAHSIVKPLT